MARFVKMNGRNETCSAPDPLDAEEARGPLGNGECAIARPRLVQGRPLYGRGVKMESDGARGGHVRGAPDGVQALVIVDVANVPRQQPVGGGELEAGLCVLSALQGPYVQALVLHLLDGALETCQETMRGRMVVDSALLASAPTDHLHAGKTLP